jgi:hypothetical protein
VATADWATGEGKDLARLPDGLGKCGGFCDCEVVMKVDVDEVLKPV